MVNIFEAASEKAMPEWVKFVNAGDNVQGTYVGKIEGQIDGYGNEQVIYQLLREDGKLVNVAFGLNKKVLNQEMSSVKFGQIIGFNFKGKIQVKDKFGKMVNVNDFGLHQDSSIVNEQWLKDNANHMPEVVRVTGQNAGNSAQKRLDDFVNDVGSDDDLPFSSEGSLTTEDKLKAIEKMATEKLGTTSANVKDVVMERTGLAFISANYEKILAALAAI